MLMKTKTSTKKPRLDVHQLYERIRSWHQKNKQKAQLSLNRQKKYLALIQNLPDSEDASVADICFVCSEIHDGLMAWSRDEKDKYGVRMAEYAEKAIEKLGGRLQAYQSAEKSKLAWKYWPKKSILMKLLHPLPTEELRRLYLLYQEKPKISEAATKKFILRKVMEEVPSDQLFGNPKVSSMLASDYEELYLFFKHRVLDLEKSDIEDICGDLRQKEIIKRYKSKAKRVDKLFENVPVSKILDSKVLQKKLKSKPSAKSDIRKIDSAIKALNVDIKQLRQKNSDLLPYVQEVEQKLRHIIRQQEKFATLLDMEAALDVKSLLESLRKELVALGDPVSPDTLVKIIERVQNKLHIDRLSFTLKGLEIIVSLYILDQIKNMKWPPDFEEFMRIVREEIPNIQILPNQAEIPTLRERVSQRLGISNSTFDDQLVEAWKKGYVKLDVGAPIGRGNVKYLKYGKSEYFYVKLL